MGSWDVGSFGNDAAADWVFELEEAEDLSVVESALNSVIEEAESDNYVESPTGCEAVAACEVIARLKSNFGKRDAFSEGVDNWVANHVITPDTDLIAKALRVLGIVRSEQSELYQLWKESDSFADWEASIDDLLSRVRS